MKEKKLGFGVFLQKFEISMDSGVRVAMYLAVEDTASEPGLIVGLNSNKFSCVVMSIVPFDVASQKFSSYDELTAALEPLGAAPLGVYVTRDSPRTPWMESVGTSGKRNADMWLTVTKGEPEGQLEVISMHSCSFRYEAISKVILFDREKDYGSPTSEKGTTAVSLINLSKEKRNAVLALFWDTPQTHRHRGSKKTSMLADSYVSLWGSMERFASRVLPFSVSGAQLRRKCTGAKSDQRGSFGLFLIVDSLLGFITCCLTIGNAKVLAHYLRETAFSVPSDAILSALGWLRAGSPAGLKLNKNLNEFVNAAFVVITTLWKYGLRAIAMYMWPSVITAAAASCVLGLSWLIATLYDTTSFIALEIYWQFSLLSRLLELMFHVLKTLTLLFRGKMWNTLRNRIDSHDYGIGQLIAGVFFLAISAFLTPTVWVYYATFFCFRIIACAIRTLIGVALLTVNFFPFQGVADYFAHKPSGKTTVSLEKNSKTKTLSYKISPRALSLSEVFEPLFQKIRALGFSAGIAKETKKLNDILLDL